MKAVLVTGASGEIGTGLRQSFAGRIPLLRLSDRETITDLGEGEEFVGARLEDAGAVSAAMEGMDAVIHLGGKAQEGVWEDVLQANIIGTYNVFEAARAAGVKRIVFASSHHVIGYHRRDTVIGPEAPIRPDSRYAASKIFGEALGRLYADKYGIGVVCLRIGSYQSEPRNERMLSTWLSPRDTADLVWSALTAAAVHFEVVYGVSANDRSFWTDEAEARLGHRRRDNAETFAGAVLVARAASASADFSGGDMSRDDVLTAVTANTNDEPDASRLFQGGPLCAMEFAGDVSKID